MVIIIKKQVSKEIYTVIHSTLYIMDDTISVQLDNTNTVAPAFVNFVNIDYESYVIIYIRSFFVFLSFQLLENNWFT